MKLSVSIINDILKEAYYKYESRSAEEYMAYMDGFTDLLNLVVMDQEAEENSRSEQAII